MEMNKLMIASLLALPLGVVCPDRASAFFAVVGTSSLNSQFQAPRLMPGFENRGNPSAHGPAVTAAPSKNFPGGPAPWSAAGTRVSAKPAPAPMQPTTSRTSAQTVSHRKGPGPQEGLVNRTSPATPH
jgi:hypothetical protein